MQMPTGGEATLAVVNYSKCGLGLGLGLGERKAQLESEGVAGDCLATASNPNNSRH